jgi:hypothetical protein
MLRIFFICFLFGNVYSQNIRTSHLDKCNKTYIILYDSSNLVKELKITCIFNFEEDDCNVLEKCYNEFNWLSDNQTIDTYSQSYSNHWHKNGMPNRILSFYQDSLIVYNHYSEKGQLIGQEFFKHDIKTQTFFIYTGTWWKMEGRRKKKIKKHPIYYEPEYFEY